MTEYVIIDPYACSVERHRFPDLGAAKKFADLNEIDIGHVWGPFADQPGCAIAVYEFGLLEPPDQHKFFALCERLYAGRAILFGFDHQGRTVDAPDKCTYTNLNPIWLDDESEVERAISSKLVMRPETKVNNIVVWKWPPKHESI